MLTTSGFQQWISAQMRVVGAIVRKDLLVFFRYPANAIMTVIEPIMFLTPAYFMGLGFSVGGRAVGFEGFTGTADHFSFVLIGAFMGSYISAAFWGIAYSVKEDMLVGVLESNWVSPAGRVTLIIGRSIFMLIGTTLNSLVVLILGALIFRLNLTGDVLIAVLTMIPMLIALAGFGLGLAGIVLVVREADTAIDISNYLVGTLSGSKFPVAMLPRPILAIALALPTTYGFDAVRGILLGTKTLMPMRQEFLIMIGSMTAMCIGGYFLFRTLERRCRRLGVLGTY
ncbi:MAG: ABC transporter permease [Clostridia bacterium]|nr:ABC transporter permease [Clostridia bacterium]